MSQFASSLYHPDHEAPAGQGRALEQGDTVAYHTINSDKVGIGPPGTTRWTLLESPRRDPGGQYGPQLVRAVREEWQVEGVPVPVSLTREDVILPLTGFDIVGCGNMRMLLRTRCPVCGHIVEVLDGKVQGHAVLRNSKRPCLGAGTPGTYPGNCPHCSAEQVFPTGSFPAGLRCLACDRPYVVDLHPDFTAGDHRLVTVVLEVYRDKD